MTAKLKPLKPYEPGWPHSYCTRAGRPARVICTDAKGGFPLVALIVYDSGEDAQSFLADGHACSHEESYSDLMCAAPPEPELVEKWLVIDANKKLVKDCASADTARRVLKVFNNMKTPDKHATILHMQEVRK